MTLQKLHSSRTGSARPAEYTIRQQSGRFRIYDKQQRFRCEFATLPAAQAYIEARATERVAALPDGRLAWEVGA